MGKLGFSRRAAAWLVILLTGALTVAVFTSPASAAVGDITFSSCASETGSFGDCANVPGAAFDAPRAVLASPDGKSLYVGSHDSVSHFFVGPDGSLTFGGCVSQDGSGGFCANVPGDAFLNPRGMAMSADGDSLYVASEEASSVSHFFVAPAGQLTFGGCVSQDGSGGFCANVPGSAFFGAVDVATSPNGNSVYVASEGLGSDSVTHFTAAPAGQLTFAGCVADSGGGGACTDVPGAAFHVPIALALSPDGDSLYVLSEASESITRFTVAPAGQITFGGCFSNGGSGGFCAVIPGSAFGIPLDLAVSPDGTSIYVSANASDGVAHFSAAPGGQLTPDGCISNDGSGGACADLPGTTNILDRPYALALSPDGGSLYVGGEDSDTVVHLRAGQAGRVTYAGCSSNTGSGGACTDVPGGIFDKPEGLAVSPDGSSLFASSANSDSLIRFAREVPPPDIADITPPAVTLTAAKTRAGKPVKVTVSCDEACSVDLTGSAKPKRSKPGNLKPATTGLGAGATATLKLKPQGKLKKALRRSGKGRATIDATATDAAGNSADASTKVKLK